MGPPIELVHNTWNFSTKVYPLALVKKKQLDEFLDENLKKPTYMPIEINQWHPQFSSSKRKTVAYIWSKTTRKLNAVTVKNSYPLPLIPDTSTRSLKPRPSISLSWTSAGDTKTFGSKEEMSGRLPFR